MNQSALDGLRIIDLTIARAGPTAVRLLSDWGADVIRIERPGNRDGLTGRHRDPDYMNLHRNTRLLALDLKQPKGQEILYELLGAADVLVENFRPPVKQRLGIDYATLSERYPRLVCGSISGYGQDGPYADKGAVDQIIQGFSGIQGVTGHPDSEPVRVGVPITDLAAGHQLAVGLLVALLERNQSGLGQWVHVSLVEAGVSFMDFQMVKYANTGFVPERVGNNHPNNSPTGTFTTATDRINISASTDKLWRALLDGLGDEDVAKDPRFATHERRVENRAALDEALTKVFEQRPASEWLEQLDARGVPCGPVHSVPDVLQHPVVLHHEMMTKVKTPEGNVVEMLRTPVQLSRTPSDIHRSSPLPGLENAEILSELGYSPDEIESFVATGLTEPHPTDDRALS